MNFPQPHLKRLPFHGTLKCGALMDDCKKDATWHILWNTDEGSNYTSLSCDMHMEMYRKNYVFLDQHRASINCDMPGSHWSGDHCTV